LEVEIARLTSRCSTLDEQLQGNFGARYAALNPSARAEADIIMTPLLINKLEKGMEDACKAWRESQIRPGDFFTDLGFPKFPTLQQRVLFWTGPGASQEMSLLYFTTYRQCVSINFESENHRARLHDPQCIANWDAKWGKKSETRRSKVSNGKFRKNYNRKGTFFRQRELKDEECGAWADKRERKKTLNVITTLDGRLLVKSHGSILTAGVVETTLAARWLGRISHKGHGFLSSRRIIASALNAEKLVEEITARYKQG
jgi:hypothetical protein